MSILITAISEGFPDLASYSYAIELKHFLYVYIGIFFPLGADPTYPPISPQSLRCSPLAVVHYASGATASTFVNGWGGSASSRE